MEMFTYDDRFHEALQQAFASSDPAVRMAYFELASFYREKAGVNGPLQPSQELLHRLASKPRARAGRARS
jgi:hypothetical protein